MGERVRTRSASCATGPAHFDRHQMSDRAEIDGAVAVQRPPQRSPLSQQPTSAFCHKRTFGGLTPVPRRRRPELDGRSASGLCDPRALMKRPASHHEVFGRRGQRLAAGRPQCPAVRRGQKHGLGRRTLALHSRIGLSLHSEDVAALNAPKRRPARDRAAAGWAVELDDTARDQVVERSACVPWPQPRSGLAPLCRSTLPTVQLRRSMQACALGSVFSS